MKKYRGKPKPVSALATQSMNIFDALKSESIHLRVVVHDWLKLYKQEETSALADLLDFVLQSCGLKPRTIAAQDLEKHDMEELVKKIHTHAEETQDYPLMSTQKVYKNFFLNFQFFWVHFVTMANEQLYDEVLLSFVINWMSQLSCSKFRPIRHTSTAALLAVGQAIIDVLNIETKDAERVKTFIASETQKDTGQRLERLKEQEKEISFRVQTLKDVIDTMLNDVLCHRCKDIMSEIRSLCVQYLGSLVTKCPEQYLNDKVLGCIGLMLYDKQADVREHALDYIIRIYTSGDDNMERMKEFTSKHIARLVEMCHDIENKCCALALKLCTLLAKKGVMEEDKVNVLCFLLWADSDDIRNAAGDFVTIAKFRDILPKETESGCELDQGRQVDAERVVLSLVSFFKNYGGQQLFRVKLLMQCFWEKTPALKRWEVICDLLQRGEKVNSTQLEESDQNVLIHFLLYALEVTRNSEKNTQKTQYLNLSSLLFKCLPNILTLFRQSAGILGNLVSLIPVLDLNAISSKDIRGSISQLVSVMKVIFLQTSNGELIMKLGRAFDHLCSSAHPLQKEVKEQITHIIDEVTRETNEAVKGYILEDTNEDIAVVWLSRTASLLAIQDIVDEIGSMVLKDVTGMISRYRSEATKNKQLATSCLYIVFYCHLWQLGRLGRSPKLIDTYLTARDLAIDQFAATVECHNADRSIRRLAFKLLCETLMLNSGQPAQGCAIYYFVGGDLIRILCEFVENLDTQIEPQQSLRPQGAFLKLSAPDLHQEDADESTQEMCVLVARLICNCPSVTSSQLPSTFLALFGVSPYRSIATLAKQVVTYMKTKDLQQSGVFKDNSVYCNILLESLMKCFGDHKKESLNKSKDMARKVASLQGSGPLKPKQAERLKDMVYEGITFALACHENFPFLEVLTSFLNKNFLSPVQMQEIFERVTKDLQKMHDIVNQEAPGRIDLLLPLTNFHSMLARLSGNRVESIATMISRKPRLKGLEAGRRNEPDLVVSGIVKSEDEEEDFVPEKSDRKERLVRRRDENEDDEAELDVPRVRKAARKTAQSPPEPIYSQPIIKEEDGALIIEASMKPPPVDFTPDTNSEERVRSAPFFDPEIQLPTTTKKAARKSAKPPSPQPEIKDEPLSDSDTLEITCENGPEPPPVPGKRTTREENLYDDEEDEVEEPVGRSRRSAIRRRLLEM